MALSERELKLYYGGDTHACGYKILPTTQEMAERQFHCGQIIPPDETVERLLSFKMGTYACIREDNLHQTCIYVKKLYTPNFFLDNWGWIALAAIVGCFFLRARLLGKRSGA